MISLRLAMFLTVVGVGVSTDPSCCVLKGQGGCKDASGLGIQDYVRQYPQDNTIQGCVQMCADNACCTGVEASLAEGCEIYTDVTPVSSSGAGDTDNPTACYDCSACVHPDLTPAAGGIWSVTDECRLQQAIDAAQPSDVIEVEGALVVWSARTISAGTLTVRGKDGNAKVVGHVGRDADTNQIDGGNPCFDITGGTVTFANLTFVNCTAYGTGNRGNGGAIHAVGPASVLVENCVLSDCHSRKDTPGGGGGIFVSDGGFISVVDSIIERCTSNLFGGGVYIEDDSSSIVITGTRIQRCEALNGGGLYNEGAAVNITNSLVVDNSAVGGNGGALYHSWGGSMVLRDVVFGTNNLAQFGRDLAVFSAYNCSNSGCGDEVDDAFSEPAAKCFQCPTACKATALCPVDCVMGWSDWSACSSQGKRSRSAVTVTPASNGGQACDRLEGEEQMEDCGVDCAANWELSGAKNGCQCRGTDSTQMPTEEYVYRIDVPALNNGTACEAAEGDVRFFDCGSPFECNGEFTEGECIGGKITRTFQLNAPFCGPDVQCWDDGYTDQLDCQMPSTTAPTASPTAPTPEVPTPKPYDGIVLAPGSASGPATFLLVALITCTLATADFQII